MIKTNLAKASATPTVEAQSVASGGLANFSPSDNFAKVVAILVFAFGVYGYESYTLSGKAERFRVVSMEAEELQEQVVKFGPVTAVVEDLAKEREKLNKQMEVIQKISEKRAFKLSSITALQESIPTDTWIEEMDLGQETINFKGYARTPSSVQQIVARLSELDFMSNVLNKELTIKKIGKSQVHEFNIEARMK